MSRAGYPLTGLLCSKVAAWLSTGQTTGLGLKVLAEKVLGRESPPYDPTIGIKTGAEVLEYACHDALNTLELGVHYTADWYAEKGQHYEWFLEECRFGLLLGDMQARGIGLDRKGLAAIREEGKEELARLHSEWDKLAPCSRKEYG
jgi:hypothetical protein